MRQPHDERVATATEEQEETMTAVMFSKLSLLEHHLEQAQKNAVELGRSDDQRLKNVAGTVHGAVVQLIRDVIRLQEECKVD